MLAAVSVSPYKSGLVDIVFAGNGSLPEDFFAFPTLIGHGTMVKLLVALIVPHIVGALYHQFSLKDRLFRRIWFGKTDV